MKRLQALRIVETSYLSAATSLIWMALYYLPIGGALFRLALPLPLALLHIRRGSKAAFEGVSLSVLLLIVLMGPVRGPLILFPYGILSFWIGWCWYKNWNWWISWIVGVFIGVGGFLVRVIVLSLLVGENLWVIITRAGASLIERFVDLFNLPFSPDTAQVQLVAIGLVILQEVIFVLSLHALAFWIFPRLQASMPEPPSLLSGLIAMDPR
ncbi:DUF2232 domain-containing protein [Prochlorococcus sp. MIT 1223]|uniref:DUF2232 domain-containing protein n=1 Tax=Prochlorococcus sp. MIT 1223 TaxID=3096217 RepID=UPI002A75E37E|nr:DUF2232 domain-containing protein [Prochlorococcus sp. MIT 1223]